ncbi:uncharacterized protein LOC132205134 [Neocloeon triangulifer]|uniref:uncharacterized protein LOC132205134 n=1 Tax=Neocloeon triangulifer TaxID=2078957 RepID=UPI00286F4C66|nr:uncharacterized protein LOC132205134 [Neocloeon triangulifer]XP_059490001.1 uncharacterized protein LOC132205134 [Neocloeon triangulifer]
MMRKVVLIGLICVLAVACCEKTKTEEVEELLNAGDQLDLGTSKDLILLIGSTGVGKSTLSKFLTHNPSLQSTKVGSSYVFIDNGTISTITSKSMTLLPNVYQDKDTGLIIVDCPGFSDTREPKFEIAASYFVKQVLEYAKKLKIILAENHFSLTEGADRFGLKRLLKHVSELIPNIERFRGSLALIATKVINQGIPDEEEKADIMTFMNNFATDLRNDLANQKQNATLYKTNEGILRALEVIYGDGSGSNLALFRKPNKAGSPWESSLLQKCYADIRSLIFETTPWIDNTNQVYHYTLTTDSIVFIKDHLVPNNNRNVMAEVNKILSLFLAGIEAKISSSAISVDQKIQTVNSLKSQYSNVLGQLVTVKDLVALSENLSKVSSIQGTDPKVLERLVFKAQFFNDVGGVDIRQFVSEVRKEATKTDKRLGDISQFYQFLQTLKLKLEEYSPQFVRQSSFRHITKADFKDFIFDASKFNIEFGNKNQILSIPLTDYMIADLNQVLSTSLNYIVNYVHDPQSKHLLIEARNLLTSEINNKIGAYQGVETVTIIAAKKIFVDQNLALINANLNFIAPVIEVINDNKEIKLFASDAGPFPGKAADSNALTVPGAGGHAGYPGSNAGNFLLLANDVIKPDLLTVTSVGGRGGRGQNGGNGRNGVASGYPTVGAVILSNANDVDNHIRNQGFGVERSGDYLVVINQRENVLPSSGGDGGAGGAGGRPGHIMVKVKNHASGNLIKTAQVIGTQGEGGDGGIGGVGMSQCARKHYGCTNHELRGRCGPWYRRRGCTTGWEYKCFPQNLDNCGNYPNGSTGNKGTSHVGTQPNHPLKPYAYGQLWHQLNERVGPYQSLGNEYSELYQYAQNAIDRS